MAMNLATDPLQHEAPRYVVGIDLGTTNSAVCYVDTAEQPWRVRVLEIPQLVAPGQVEVDIQGEARMPDQKARANASIVNDDRRRGLAETEHHSALIRLLRPLYNVSRTMKENATMPPASQCAWA